MRNLISILKIILPSRVRILFRQLEKSVVYRLRREKIKFPVMLGTPVKIIIGAAMTYQVGWYSTNEQWLDLTSEKDWKKVFKGKVLVVNALAEHVFEHLTEEEIKQALQFLRSHMPPGGRIRIAVPDGYHPDPIYIKHIGIAGIGPDAADHKQLLNKDKLCCYLKDAGFVAEMLEGYLSNGELVQKSIDPSGGLVIRSRSNPKTMDSKEGWDFVDANTSLIVDGVLPA